MSDWLPYLRQLYGSNNEQEMQTMLRYRTALSDTRLLPSDRVAIIDWFAQQAVNRQLFVLPEMAELFAYRSAATTSRVIDLVDELLGKKHAGPLLRLRQQLGRASAESYTAAYERLVPLIASAAVPPPGALADISQHRDATALLALLIGVEHWRAAVSTARASDARQQPEGNRGKWSGSILGTPAASDLLRVFDGWLREGHAFVRYLIVRWIAESGLTSWLEHRIEQKLTAIFETDRDPIAAGFAIQALAATMTDEAHASAFAETLVTEYDTLRLADKRKWEEGVDPTHATREIAMSILHALGALAVRHPSGPPMEALRSIVTADPLPWLNLLPDRGAPPNPNAASILRAALRLQGEAVFVRLRVNVDQRVASAGLSVRLPFVDPKKFMKRSSGTIECWARPRPMDVPADPLQWTFELVEIAAETGPAGTARLRHVLCPALQYERGESVRSVMISGTTFAATAPEKEWMPWPLRDHIVRQLQMHADTLCETIKILARIITATPSGSSEASWALHYVWQIAITSVFTPRTPSTDRLSAILRSALLNDLARPDVFEKFVPGEPQASFEFSFLSSLLRELDDPSPRTRAWLLSNASQLLAIIRDEEIDVKDRGRLAVTLRWAAVDLPEHLRAELDALPLPSRVVTQYTPATMFVSDEGLELEVRRGHENADWPVWRQPSPGAMHWGAVWMERLARTLLGQGSWDVQDAAARAIEIVTLCRDRYEAIIRQLALRTLDAIGRNIDQPEGNVLRLRDQLLRLPGSAVIRQYVRARAARADRYDEDWVRLLVRLLERSDLRSQSAAGSVMTIQKIVDRLARQRVILRELVRYAAAGGEQYLTRYLKLRRLDVTYGEQQGWIECDGEVIAEQDLDGAAPAFLSLLHESDDAETPIDMASNTALTIFVHQPERSQRFRCIASRLSLPPGAIDFHTLDVSADDRLKIGIERLVADGALVAIGRVHVQPSGAAIVDTGLRGVGCKLPRQASEGERVLVHLAFAPSVESATLDLAEIQPGQTLHDLRERDDAVEQLQQHQGDAPFVVRATVMNKAGNGQYTVNAGFRVGGLSPLLRIARPIRVNDWVPISVSKPLFATNRALRIARIEEIADPLPTVFAGQLVAREMQRDAGRQWEIRYGDQTFPLERRELTADLPLLYALDRLPDGDQRLQNLEVAVAMRAGAPTLLGAPPRFTAMDLLLATSAGTVEAVVFLREEQDGSAVFQIVPRSYSTGRGPLPVVGALVRVRDGELFDSAGRPFSTRGLVRGERLELEAVNGIVQPDGSSLADAADVEETFSSPLLRATRDPVNIDLASALKPGTLVTIVTHRNTELVDAPEGLPRLHVETQSEERRPWPVAGENEAIVTEWDPFARAYALRVERPRSHEFELGPRPADRLEKWFDLHAGDVLNGTVRFWQKGSLNLSIFGCVVWLDSSLPWLTPSLPTAERYNASGYRVKEIMITEVRGQQWQAIVRVPASEMPVVADLIEGVVTSVPQRDGVSHRMGISWLLVDAEERPITVPTSVNLPASAQVYIGDLARAVVRNGQAAIEILHRRIQATPLCRTYPVRPKEGRPIRATFLAAPQSSESGDDVLQSQPWLFVADPGVLMEVQPGALGRVEQLHGRALDFAVLEPGSRDWTWKVRSVEPGHISRAAEEEVVIEAAFRGFVQVTSKHPDFANWPRLTLRAAATERRRGPMFQIGSAMVLSRATATVSALEDDIFTIELEAQLTRPNTVHVLPSLMDELREQPRLDVEGTVEVEDRKLNIRLTSHEHPSLLPLEMKEETWLPYSRDRIGRIGPKSFTFLAVLQDSQPLLSLVRHTPLPLGEWLEEKRLTRVADVRNRPLFYVGRVDDDVRRLTGFVGDGYLFEHTPGDSVVVPEQDLLFRGQPFDDGMLAPGEIVQSYRLERPVIGQVKLDAQTLKHDIVRELEHLREKRILVIDVTSSLALSERLRLVAGEEPMNFGAWDLRVDGAEGTGLVYARFERTEEGVIVCKGVSASDAFTLGNLVYVRVRETAEYGVGSMKAIVDPLSGTLPRQAFIPDTRFSERRRILGEGVAGALLLASVVEVPPADERSDKGIVLTLTKSPNRRLGTVLNAIAREEPKPKQALLKHYEPESGVLELELAPGFNGAIPERRFAEPEMLAQLKRGDILFLRISPDRSKISIARRIESQRERLARGSRTVLAKLWGDEHYQKGKNTVEANIVGYPQLKARVGVAGPYTEVLPHYVDHIPERSEFVTLLGKTAREARAGRLILRNGQPQIDGPSPTELSWSETTFRFACHDVLRGQLPEWRWRDFGDYEQGVDERSIDTGLVVAELIDGSPSLTVAARRPCPVDHLVEQFGEDARDRFFIVAAADSERLVLEVAPGRYAELPALMIEPLAGARFASGLSAHWSWLRPGDRLKLRLLPAAQGKHPYLPNFKIVRVEPSMLRHLASGAVGPLVTDGTHIFFGAAGESGIHVDGLQRKLMDVVLDLFSDVPSFSHTSRIDELAQKWREAGSRLVLAGKLRNQLSLRRGTRIFVDVGVPLPGPDGAGDASEIVDARALPNVPATMRVRILDLEIWQGQIRRCEYQIESGQRPLLRVDGPDRAVHVRGVQPGDTVAAYAPSGDASIVRVWGFESLVIEWTPDPDDPLQLHRQPQRAAALNALLAADGLLWMTVEGLSPQEGTIRLSRRNQLAMLGPCEGRVVRARVRGALDGTRILLEVAGVPMAIAAGDFCAGLESASTEYARFLASSAKRAEVDVLVHPHGRITADDVHVSIEDLEFDTMIEYAAESGLVCVAEGRRLFVPIGELAWCGNFSPAAMKAIFRRDARKPLRLRRTESGFSHAATAELVHEAKLLSERLEQTRPRVDELPRKAEPIYVRRNYVESGRAIASTQRGLIVEVRYLPETEVEEGQVVYIEEIDLLQRRVITTTETFQAEKWRFVHPRGTRPAQWQEDDLKAASNALVDLMLPSASIDDLVVYLSTTRLAVTTVSIRRVLDMALLMNRLPCGTGGETLSSFGRFWFGVAAVLAGGEPASPFESFGAGYCYLLSGKPALAIRHLQAAAAAMPLSFDVHFSLVRAWFLLKEERRATRLLRSTCRRLFAHAHATMTPPFIDAEDTLPSDNEVAGTTGRSEQAMTAANRRAPLSASVLSRQICLATSNQAPVGPDFDMSVKNFLESISDEEDFGQPIDPRLYALAAQLAFACGDVARGWQYLDRTCESKPASLAIERTLAAWLRRELPTRPSPLLQQLRDLMVNELWRELISGTRFEELWALFTKSTYEWSIAPHEYRVLSHHDALAYLRDNLPPVGNEPPPAAKEKELRSDGMSPAKRDAVV
jgi:hypothetical protein